MVDGPPRELDLLAVHRTRSVEDERDIHRVAGPGSLGVRRRD
jgi:hypothetical protein